MRASPLVLLVLLVTQSVYSQPVSGVTLTLTGDWQVEIVTPQGRTVLDVPLATIVTVESERFDRLPPFDAKASGWRKGARLHGVIAQECTVKGLLDPASLQLRAAAAADSPRFELGKDFAADLDWGTFGRLPGGKIGENQPVIASYRHGLSRIDSIVRSQQGKIKLRQGTPHPAAPLPASLHEGDTRLTNIFVAGRIARLSSVHLFPILETAYPEPVHSTALADERLPKTMKKLRNGGSLRVLAWGDSVTDGGFLPNRDRDRWQAQFVARLAERYPKAKIELVTEAWGGRSTASYLAEPPGSVHNYQEKVLGAKPDLIVSEFVNDSGLNAKLVEERYGRLLADFRKIGAEWIILTPHYVRGDWMGLASEREIDRDPRPYVEGLRQFAVKHRVALADASLRWGRLWRQGIPYSTLLLNAINHPDARGMKLFGDALMVLLSD